MRLCRIFDVIRFWFFSTSNMSLWVDKENVVQLELNVSEKVVKYTGDAAASY